MRKLKVKGTLTTTALVLLVGGALAQDAPRGTVLQLDVSTGLRFHDNLGLDTPSAGNTLRSETNLGASLTSETKTQQIALSFGATLRAENSPVGGGTVGFENPNVALSYARQAAHARFAFDASYTRNDVDGFTAAFDPELGSAVLISDDGVRNSYRASSTLALGTNGPLGLTFRVSSGGTLYTGTSDPGLFDTNTTSVSLAASLDFSTVTVGTTSVSFSRFTAEDAPGTVRDSMALSFGVEHTLAQGMVLAASLGARRIDDSVAGVSDSGEGSLSVTRALPNGEMSASLTSVLTSAGRVDRLTAGRRLEFPSWAVSANLGVVNAAGVATAPSFNLAYSREMKRGEISASLSADVSVNNQSQVQRVINTDLGYTHLLGEASSVGFGVSYTDFSDAGSTGLVARQRGALSATYNHALARDWTLSAGFERRYLRETGTTAWDNAVFVTVGRSFVFLP